MNADADIHKLLKPVRLITHSCVRLEASDGFVVYVDPYDVPDEPHDADVVLVTHDHYDHFSPEDIAKVSKPGTRVGTPESTAKDAAALPDVETFVLAIGDSVALSDTVSVETVPSYNIGKKFHPKANGWLGYIVSVDGNLYFHMGDTDQNPDNEHVDCDVLLIPVGGTYTMNVDEAVTCALSVVPTVAVPMHYGTVAGDADCGKRFADELAACQVGIASPIASAVIMGE
jgi:L-ascorbate metabolism protein UlaG (beta-lactamase superfamily)